MAVHLQGLHGVRCLTRTTQTRPAMLLTPLPAGKWRRTLENCLPKRIFGTNSIVLRMQRSMEKEPIFFFKNRKEKIF